MIKIFLKMVLLFFYCTKLSLIHASFAKKCLNRKIQGAILVGAVFKVAI